MRSFFMSALFCLLLAGPLHGQLLEETSEEPAVSRQEQLDRFQELTVAGAPFEVSEELKEEYLSLIQDLHYHDLWADYLERELNRPGNPEAAQVEKWILLAEARFRTGTIGTQQTLLALQRALELEPDHDQALALLGQLHHREGNYDLAEKYYTKALSSNPENALASIGNAALLARKGEVLKSSQILDDLGVKAQPHDIETRLMLRQALHDFQRRGGWFADTVENHSAYSRLLYRAGRLTDAVLAARHSTALDPSQYEQWNFIASMQLQIGNLDRAKEAYDSSLEANPDQPAVVDARRQLINTLTTSGAGKAP
ncbi:MAG: tetratricopeptide repeat protein [Candidatus Hydrogenedens sp.]|jgi:tetratricopeptide (TPR) repeat protein|nr:tetratricopeptide repeat protein [Candidatus Hydrogenedens sp.]